MRFEIRKWRKLYNEVQRLGQMLQDSTYKRDEKRKIIRPSILLNREQRDSIDKRIKKLLEEVDRYLQDCGFSKPQALWRYDSEDSRTWPSEPNFMFGHLLERDE